MSSRYMYNEGFSIGIRDPTWKYIGQDDSGTCFQTKISNGYNRFLKILIFFLKNHRVFNLFLRFSL